MTTEVQLSSFIETELEKFDETTETLKALVEPVKGLTIKGLEDRDGFIQVREARLKLKSKRVEIEKNGRALRDNAIRFQKAVIARQEELVQIIVPEEIRLKQEEDHYEELKEQQRIANEREETQRVQGRINALATYNYAIDFYEAKIMSDEDFGKLLDHAHQEYQKEQDRIAAEKAEQERLRKEEEERLRLEREELERQRQENIKREQELAAERDRIRKIQEEKEAEMRAEQDRIRKEQEDREAALRKEREAIEAEKRKIELEQAKREAAERARIEAEEKARYEEQQRIERERVAQQEAIRQSLLKPYKEKMLEFAGTLQSIVVPAGQDSRSIKLTEEVNDFLEKLSSHIKEKVKNL
jgi:hypothetical protein